MPRVTYPNITVAATRPGVPMEAAVLGYPSEYSTFLRERPTDVPYTPYIASLIRDGLLKEAQKQVAAKQADEKQKQNAASKTAVEKTQSAASAPKDAAGSQRTTLDAERSGDLK